MHYTVQLQTTSQALHTAQGIVYSLLCIFRVSKLQTIAGDTALEGVTSQYMIVHSIILIPEIASVG